MLGLSLLGNHYVVERQIEPIKKRLDIMAPQLDSMAPKVDSMEPKLDRIEPKLDSVVQVFNGMIFLKKCGGTGLEWCGCSQEL